MNNKRINIVTRLLMLLVISGINMQVVGQSSIRISLAEWTFDQWYGGGVAPLGQLTSKPVFADRGTLASTACVGTEQMFASGGVARVWDVPTTGGYVRCNKDWTASGERYYLMSGISTVGCANVRITSSHATSSSSYAYQMKLQYRIGTEGVWVDLYGPFEVKDVTESGINKKQVNEVALPSTCNGVPSLQLRWLLTKAPSSSSTQFRLDNLFLTADVSNPDPTADKTPLIEANALVETDWAVPSWTLMLTARKRASEAPITANLQQLREVMSVMLRKEVPYCVNVAFNGNPSTNMGIAWYTNEKVTGGQAQLVAKADATEGDFLTPLTVVSAVTTALSGVNYLVTANDPVMTAGLASGVKRNYMANKVLVTGLNPATTYSYRVGKPGAWSAIGSFSTVAAANKPFSFIYLTDTQANSNDNFACSAHAMKEAYRIADNPLFALVTGDLVESQGGSNSEWEYEQWFETMKPVLSRLPVVSTIGNHDASSNENFFNHFSHDQSFNSTSEVGSIMNGSVYSFVVGNALFMVCNHQDVNREGYLASLATWMRQQVAIHKEVRWRIVCVHAGLFSGGSHYADAEATKLRAALLPVYDELKIDLSIQGHDHVYNVIGPINNLTRTAIVGAAYNFDDASINAPSNMNGRAGGTYDVTNGTLYFINNSASRKKYSTITQGSLNGAASTSLIPNYWSLFTGRYGQTGEPTFSEVKVTNGHIEIFTYAINNSGTTYLFDKISIVKSSPSLSDTSSKTAERIWYDATAKVVRVASESVDLLKLYDLTGQLKLVEEGCNSMNVSEMIKGVYIVQSLSNGSTTNSVVMVE